MGGEGLDVLRQLANPTHGTSLTCVECRRHGEVPSDAQKKQLERAAQIADILDWTKDEKTRRGE